MGRIDKVANALKKEVSNIIQFELNDPRLGFITIINAEISKDLKYAKVYFSVLGDKKSVKDSIAGLESAKGYIKKLVGDRLKLRFTPEIIFLQDDSAEYSIYISEKIDSLKKKRS